MQEAPDLKAIMFRYYEAVSRGDAAFMERVLSHQEGILIIGSDPREWWTEPALISRTLKERAKAGITVAPGEILAYREGSVGWISDRPVFAMPDGKKVAFRWTAVFHQEAGDWKMIQGHGSMGVPNFEAIGMDIKIEGA
jgi:hypothetical protein